VYLELRAVTGDQQYVEPKQVAMAPTRSGSRTFGQCLHVLATAAFSTAPGSSMFEA
jgi:hypothetical protein